MRWKRVVACLLSVAGLTGCPHSFGREGTLDRAAAKDTRESLETPECTLKVQEELCPENQEPSEKCLEVCGE